MVNETASRGGSRSWRVSSRAGYTLFFKHVDRPMRMMADLLRRGRYADEIMGWYVQEDRRLAEACARMGCNDPRRAERGTRTVSPSRSREVTASKALSVPRSEGLSLPKDGSGCKVRQCHGK